MQGIINLDKPAGISSARAVARVKRLLPRGMKIGHAGTLDPFATGVLLLLVGKGTKQCERLMGEPKQYETTIRLGATTATLDPESPEEPYRDTCVSNVPGAEGFACNISPSDPPLESGQDARDAIEVIGEETIRTIVHQFVGDIQQRPPVFSAMKVGGRRAYKLARAGEPVELVPRTVQVYGIELLDYSWPLLRVRIDCGRGTYIRAIARDVGEALGVGGYLTQLRRTRIGSFDASSAITLEHLEAAGVERHLHPL